MVNEIILKIKALFEGKGAEQAEQKLKDLGEAGKSASVDVNKMGSSIKDTSGRSVVDVNRMGSSFKGAAGLAGQMNAVLAQGGPEAQKLAGGMRLLGGVINGLQGGIMGIATVLVGVGVSAFMKWRNAVAEAEKKIEEFRKQYLENEAAMRNTNFDKSIEEHGKLRAAVDAEADAYSRLSSARAAVDNAEKAARMAELSLLEKEAMGRLGIDDEMGRAKVTADFAERRRDLDYEYQRRSAEREADVRGKAYERAAELEAVTRREQEENARQLDAAERKKRQLVQQYTDLYGEGTAPMKTGGGGRVTVGTTTVTTPTFQVVDRERQEKEAAAIREQLKPLNDTIRKLADAAEKLGERNKRESTELEVRSMELDAASRSLDTVSRVQPRINAADTAAARRDIAHREDRAADDRISAINRAMPEDGAAEISGMGQRIINRASSGGSLLEVLTSIERIVTAQDRDKETILRRLRNLETQQTYR